MPSLERIGTLVITENYINHFIALDAMHLSLFVEESESLKMIRVPHFVVKDLVRDRLSESEISRIHRLASPVEKPEAFKSGSVVVDFSQKTARCFNAKLNLPSNEPTWTLISEKLSLENY